MSAQPWEAALSEINTYRGRIGALGTSGGRLGQVQHVEKGWRSASAHQIRQVHVLVLMVEPITAASVKTTSAAWQLMRTASQLRCRAVLRPTPDVLTAADYDATLQACACPPPA